MQSDDWYELFDLFKSWQLSWEPYVKYPSWEEIMGMEIVIDEDVLITSEELTTGLLWENTYYGGTEEMEADIQ